MRALFVFRYPKEIEQWLLRITDYAERLLNDLDGLDWPEKTKAMQRHWIGRSEGAEIEFRIKNLESGIRVFTTRLDTIFGCTYLVVAPEHPIIKNYESEIKNYEEVKKYIEEAKKKSELQRTELAKEKTGVELKGFTPSIRLTARKFRFLPPITFSGITAPAR